MLPGSSDFFFFNDTATTEIYTLSLHDALPIWLSDLADRHVHLDGGLARALAGTSVSARALAAHRQPLSMAHAAVAAQVHQPLDRHRDLAAQDLGDRKSTRLNSSHGYISYAVFCLKKKK